MENKARSEPNPSRALRARAEALLGTMAAELQNVPAADIKSVIHELNVHQMELEIQNEELRQAQYELAESRDRYADLYEFAPVGYVTQTEDGTILDANLTIATMLDVSREILVGARLSSFVKPGSQDDLYRHYQSILCQDEKQSCRLAMKRTDAVRLCVQLESIAFEAEGERRCRSTLVDITSQRVAEEALQELMASLERQVSERTIELRQERDFANAVFDNLPGLALVFDPQARLVRTNRHFVEATGHSIDTLRDDADWLELLSAADREIFTDRIIRKMLSQQNPGREEISLRQCDGSYRLYSFTAAVLRDVDGSVSFIICFGVDVSDQRNAEKEARQAQQEAARLQRLQTASELATVLAHELNQPLGAISVYADASNQLLEKSPLDREKLSDNMKKISAESIRGGEIIRSLRDFVGKGEVEPVPLNLNGVVQHACELIGPKARDSKLRLVLDLGTQLPQVMGVELHLQQVLLNLLNNAIEAILDDGQKGTQITVETCRQANRVRVTIRDGGPGIDAQVAAHIFDKLHSTKDYGLGVGLRISRTLIERLGGRLWVEPKQPGGIVHFEVPIAP